MINLIKNVKKNRQNENRQNDEEEFRFDNMTARNSEYNSLYKTMIYDSECSDHFTYDKDRFINEIRFACE
jgi:hypothetical protein